MSDQDKEQLLKQIRQQLDESEDGLDAATRSRLTQIRSKALDADTQQSATQRLWSWTTPVMAMASMAVVAVVTISLLWSPAKLQYESLEDLPLLTANDAFELIDEVEFYQWLADENANG